MNDKTITDSITHERELLVAFNWAYEVLGQGIVSDAIYEYGLRNLKELRDAHPQHWQEHGLMHEYFVGNDEWTYTGSGIPRTKEVLQIYLKVKTRIGK